VAWEPKPADPELSVSAHTAHFIVPVISTPPSSGKQLQYNSNKLVGQSMQTHLELKMRMEVELEAVVEGSFEIKLESEADV